MNRFYTPPERHCLSCLGVVKPALKKKKTVIEKKKEFYENYDKSLFESLGAISNSRDPPTQGAAF